MLLLSLVPSVRADIAVVPDLDYFTGDGADPVKHKLDLYLPEGEAPAGGWPVFLFVHGGGWASGDRRYIGGTYGNVGRAVARAGIVGVVISYRLAPAVKHPEQVRDVARAIAWTQAHIAEHGGDPARMVIGGHSAGGHLVALVALDPRYLREVGVDPARIRGVAGMSGVYDLRGMTRLQALAPMVTRAFGDDPAGWDEASPITHVHAGAPEFWLNNAQYDWGLQANAELFEAKLKQFDVPVTRTVTEGTNHLTVVGNIGLADDPTTERLVAFIQRIK